MAEGHPRRVFLATATLGALAVAKGCAQWKSDPEKPVRGGLPAARSSDQVAVVEVATFPLPEANRSAEPPVGRPGDESPRGGGRSREVEAGALWQRVDEMVVPAELRQRFARNGLRIGRLNETHPLLAPPPSEPSAGHDPMTLLEQAGIASDVTNQRRRISCVPGRRYELNVRQVGSGSVAVLVHLEETLQGQSLDQPQFLFSLRARPRDDGRVVLALCPEIQHGQYQPKFVGSEMGALRVDNRREVWKLDALAAEVPLAEGEAILIAPTRPHRGLGGQMFVGSRADGSTEEVAMLFRLHRRPADLSGPML